MRMRELKFNICTISGDPGGANAIAPVIELLLQEKKVNLVNYAYNQAAGILNRRELSYVTLPNQVDAEWIKKTFESFQPDFLLTATSHNSHNWEKYFISTARELGVESMSVLDYWSNYKIRFSDHKDELIYLPDRIAVMDERAKQEMIEAGIPSDCIMIAGQPAFDALAEQRKKFTPIKKQTVRQYLGVAKNSLIVMFASQPLKKFYGNQGDQGYLGYDEDIVLKNLIQSLEVISQNRHQQICLLICPHPRENPEDYVGYKSDVISIIVKTGGDNRKYAMSADLVTGMSTALLMEAAYLNCVVLSLQPGLIGADTLPTNHSGTSVAVYCVDEILPQVNRYLLDETARLRLLQKQIKLAHSFNATRCIVDYIYAKIDAKIEGRTACKV